MNLGHLDFEVVSGFDIRISDLAQLVQLPIEQYVGNDPRTKLRCSIKYDLLGNRVYKKSTASGSATERKHVVDIMGDLPVILMEIEPASGNIMKTYIYGNSEVLAQHDGDVSADRYFYLHDRLGSVRLRLDGRSRPQRSLFDPAHYDDPDDDDEPVVIDLKGVRLERIRDFGDVWLALGLWRLVGLDELLCDLMPEGREEVRWDVMAAILAIARFCEPSSELHIEDSWYADSQLQT